MYSVFPKNHQFDEQNPLRKCSFRILPLQWSAIVVAEFKKNLNFLIGLLITLNGFDNKTHQYDPPLNLGGIWAYYEHNLLPKSGILCFLVVPHCK